MKNCQFVASRERTFPRLWFAISRLGRRLGTIDVLWGTAILCQLARRLALDRGCHCVRPRFVQLVRKVHEELAEDAHVHDARAIWQRTSLQRCVDPVLEALCLACRTGAFSFQAL